MAGQIGGTVTWVLDVDSTGLNTGLDNARRKVRTSADDIVKNTDQIKKGFSNTAADVANSLDGMARSVGGLLLATGAVIGSSSFGLLGMAKASWQQVTAVENASFALKAYEKNADKVNTVLSQLVEYARSPTGVLFQRQDLFDAASTLKLYGVETQNLVGYTKILSKGVAVGKTSFQELSDVLGRVIGLGKVTGDAFDLLVARGIKLPDSMRNASVSAEELFRALDKSLPDELLEGRAKTISGVMIRLQSSFRDLGNQLLGVDAQTSEFIEGGLGDTLVKTMQNLRDTLAAPEFKESFKRLGEQAGNFARTVIPLLINGFKWVIDNLPLLTSLFIGLSVLFVGLKIAAFVAHLIALKAALAPVLATLGVGLGTVALVVAGVAALIGVLAFLEIKFGLISNIAGKVVDALQSIWNIIKLVVTGDFQGGIFGLTEDSPFIVALIKVGQFVRDTLNSAFESLKSIAIQLWESMQPLVETFKEFWSKHGEKVLNVLKILGAVIGGIILAPLVIGFGLLVGALKIIQVVLGFVARNFKTIKSIVTTVIKVAIAPLVVIFFALYGAFIIIKKAIELFVAGFKIVVDVVSNVLQVITDVFNTIYNTVIGVFTAIWNFISPILNFIKNLFIIVFGSILLVVINVVKTLWKIWFTIFSAIFNFVKGILTKVWNFISGVFNAIWNVVYTVLSKLWAFYSGIWNAIFNVIKTIVNRIIGFFSGAWNWLYSKGKDIINGLIRGIKNMGTALWNGVKSVADRIGNFFSGAWRWLFDTGKAIIQGLINGISNMAGAVSRKAQEIADTVKNKIKGALGISSPSKVMLDYGINVGLGLEKGIDKSMNSIADISSRLAESVIPPASNERVATGTPGNTTITLTGNIYLENKEASDAFFARLNRNNELAQRGLSLI